MNMKLHYDGDAGAQSPIPNNEMTIRSFVDALVSEKKVIMVTTLIFAALAVGYCFSATKIYRAKASYYAADDYDFEAFNLYSDIASVSKEQVYNHFLRNIESYTNKKELIEKMALASFFADSREDNKDTAHFIVQDLIKSFKFIVPNKEFKAAVQKEQALNLEFEAADASLAANVINEFTQLVNEKTVNGIKMQLESNIKIKLQQVDRDIKTLRQVALMKRMNEIKGIEDEIAIKRKTLQAQIASLRFRAKTERANRIIVLREEEKLSRAQIVDKINALKAKTEAIRKDSIIKLQENLNIAKNLGIKEMMPVQVMMPGTVQPEGETESTLLTQMTAQTPLLYLLGENALKAEIFQKENRKDNDPFARELRDLQKLLMELETNEQIAVLEQRAVDDPFIKDLPELQQALRFLDDAPRLQILKARTDDDPYIPELPQLLEFRSKLSAIRYDTGSVKAFKVDQVAFKPEKPIKPKKMLIIFGAVALGLMTGLFLAFVVHFYKWIPHAGKNRSFL